MHVKFRVLTIEEVDALVSEYAGEGDSIPSTAVVKAVIYNFTSEVLPALKDIPNPKALIILNSLHIGCLMLNPGLDLDSWLQISHAPQMVSNIASAVPKPTPKKKTKVKRITKARFLNLERHLKEIVIGQNEAISEVVSALKRSQVGLSDEERPVAVFLFAGASGVGKTYLAKALHSYLFGTEFDLVRIDCGEYQHKHENQKLIGAPPGYLGHDEGGQLSNEVLKNPQTVVLLDEVEKAHPDIWNTFLTVLDEGMMTDGSGNKVSFRDTIIIMTTNLGNSAIVNDILSKPMGFGGGIDVSKLPPRARVEKVAAEAIRKQFSPEFLNRIDKTVVFNHPTEEDYLKIAELEMNTVQSKLEKRGFTLTFDPSVLQAMVREGVSHVQGARGLAQLRRDRIENSLADLILTGRYPLGTAFRVSHEAGEYRVAAHRPVSKSARSQRRAPIQLTPPPVLAGGVESPIQKDEHARI